MRMALNLAKKGQGYTSPNPMVGAVIVKDGEVVGRGFHQAAGQPHAEINAIKDAGIMEAVKALASQDKQRSMDANANIWNHGPVGSIPLDRLKNLGLLED